MKNKNKLNIEEKMNEKMRNYMLDLHRQTERAVGGDDETAVCDENESVIGFYC